MQSLSAVEPGIVSDADPELEHFCYQASNLVARGLSLPLPPPDELSEGLGVSVEAEEEQEDSARDRHPANLQQILSLLEDDDHASEGAGAISEAASDSTLPLGRGYMGSTMSRDSEGLLDYLPDRPDYNDDDDESLSSREALPANLLDVLLGEDPDEDVPDEFQDDDSNLASIIVQEELSAANAAAATWTEVPSQHELSRERRRLPEPPPALSVVQPVNQEDDGFPLTPSDVASAESSSIPKERMASSKRLSSGACCCLCCCKRKKKGRGRYPEELSPQQEYPADLPPLEDCVTTRSSVSIMRKLDSGFGRISSGSFLDDPRSPSMVSGRSEPMSEVSSAMSWGHAGYDEDEEEAFDDTKSVPSRQDDAASRTKPQLRRSHRCSCSCMFPGCFCYFVLACAATVAVPWLLLPTPTETYGAFGYVKQVQLEESISEAHFKEDLKSAVDLTYLSLPNALETDSASAGNQTYEWHYVELYWQIAEGRADNVWKMFFNDQGGATTEAARFRDVVSDAYLSEVQQAQAELMRMPSWTELCKSSQVPRLCNPGDSLITIAFGTKQVPSQAEQQAGMTSKVTFDGASQNLLMPVEAALTLVQETAPGSLQRWLPRDGAVYLSSARNMEVPRSRSLLRSVFSFKLPKDVVAARWESFVQELQPKLVEVLRKDQIAKHNLRVYYKIDGVDYDNFAEYFDFLGFKIASLAATVTATLLVTKRLLLSISAGLLTYFSSSIACGAEISAITPFVWMVLAVNCAELATACCSLWSHNRVWRRPVTYAHEVTELWRRGLINNNINDKVAAVGKAVWPFYLLVQTFAPTLGCTVFMFHVTSTLIDAPLVEAFARQVFQGGGILLVGGLLMLLPAVMLGDLFAEKHLMDDNVDCELWSILLPKELGSSPPTRSQRKQRRQLALLVVSRLQHRCVCPILCLVVIALVIVATLRPRFDYTASTPELFLPGHLYRNGQEAKVAFHGLPDPSMVDMSMPMEASECSNDAFAQNCSWNKCRADVSKGDFDYGSCDCDYRHDEMECKQSPARVVGLRTHEMDLSDRFWSWARTMLIAKNLNLNISGLQAWKNIQPIQLEDWSSGQTVLRRQSRGWLPDAAGGHSVCIRCYCMGKDERRTDGGGRRCRRPEGWNELGRTLLATPNPTLRSATDLGADNTTEVFLVWGLENQASLTSPTPQSSQMPGLANLQVQRDLLAICEGTGPNLKVVTRRCFAVDFKNWLASRGFNYPVPSVLFRTLFEQFTQDTQQRESAYKYFWLSQKGSGAIAGTLAVFIVEKPMTRAEESAMQERWKEYVGLRSRWASAGQFWFATSLPMHVQAEGAKVSELVRGPSLAFVSIIAALTLGLTCSLGLAVAAAASSGLCLLLLLILTSLGGVQQVGVLEILGMMVCMFVSVSPLMRFLLLYCGAGNGATKKKVPCSAPQGCGKEILSRDMYRSMFEGEDALRELAQEEWDRRKKELALEQQELQEYCQMSTLRSERRNRLATATRHSTAIMISHLISSLMCWFALQVLAPEVLAQVSLAYLITGLVLPGVAELVLPTLLLHGLSPTRVWWHSFCLLFGGMTGLFKFGVGADCPEWRSSKDDEQEVSLACKVVGWPFSWLARVWLRYRKQSDE